MSTSDAPWIDGAVHEVLSPTRAYPGPLAVMAAKVARAVDDRDPTGMRKRMFELGIGVARYAASLGLAVLGAPRTAELGAALPLPTQVARLLRGAARLSDGQWCELGRTLAGPVAKRHEELGRALAFLSGPALVDLVTARNRFAHEGGSGQDAPSKALAVLEEARALLSLELEISDGGATLVLAREPLSVTPWLPMVDGRPLFLDAPHTVGKRWRSMDPDTGEHREHALLDEAMRGLLGATGAPALPVDAPVLVGREAAVRLLRRGAEEAVAGGVRVVVLTGPQGIGRTRLLRTVVDAAFGLGFRRVLEDVCSDERRGALRPLRQAASKAPANDPLRVVLEKACAGELSGRAEGMGPAIEAIEEVLLAASVAEPTLLALDDAQWADEHTLAVLRLVTERATRGAEGRLLVVVVVRDMPVVPPAVRALLGQVERDVGSGATRIALEPLDAGMSARVVRGVAPVSGELESALVEGAGGSPYFLVQPLLSWHELGALEWSEGAWRARDPELVRRAPPGVAELVRARIASYFEGGSELERAAERVLAGVALADAGVLTSALLAAMESAGVDDRGCERALEGLLEVSLLRSRADGREIAFAQRAVARAVQEVFAAKPWFRRVHRALLDAIADGEEADDDAGFLAAGYEAVGAKAETEKWLERGVARGFALGDFAESERLASRLAQLAKAASTRTRGVVWVADAQLRAGRASEALETLEGAGACDGDGPLAVQARTLRFTAAVSGGHPRLEEDPRLVEDADGLGEPSLAAEARLAIAAWRRGERGAELVREALGRIGRVDEPGDLRYRALTLRLELLWESRSAVDPECRRAASEAFAAARELGSPWAELDCKLSAAALTSDAGDHVAAIALLDEVASSAATRHFGTLRRQALVSSAAFELRRGEPGLAEAAAERAAQESRAAGSVLAAVAESIRADALLRLGREGEALVAIEESLRLKREAGDANVALALLRKGEIEAYLGRSAEAAATVALALEAATAVGNADQGHLCRLWGSLHAVRSGVEGATEALEALVSELGPHEGRLRPATRALYAKASARVRDPGLELGARLLP